MRSKNELMNIIGDLEAAEMLMAELKAEVEAYKDMLKNELTERDTEVLDLDERTIRWTTFTANRLDSSRMKKELPDLYKAYQKPVLQKKFSIS